jgi:hypothetical protein
MATPVDTERDAGPASLREPPFSHGPRAPLGPTLALTVTLAVAGFVLILAVSELLVHPRPLPPPLNLGQRQTLETALYLVAFGLVGPAALIGGPRLADSLAQRVGPDALSLLAAVLLASFSVAIIAARTVAGGGVGRTLAIVALWSVAAVGLIAIARRKGRLTRSARPPAQIAPRAWAGAAALLLASLLAFVSLRSVSLVGLGLTAVASAVILVLYARRPARTRSALGGRRRLAIDAVVVAVILLAVPDLVIFAPPSGSSPFLEGLYRSIIQFHHDFVLGPTLTVLHGGPVLVDTASQYGVGNVYLLAGWFQLVPVGYGMFGLLDGILFALFFATGYSVLRLVRAPRPLAAGALALAVVVLVYNLVYSVGSLPAQHGPLRFGLPMLLVLATAFTARWPHRARAGTALQLVTVGLASVWALEAAVYTLATFAAITAFEAWTSTRPRRLSAAARRAALGLLACVAAHLVLVAATLIFAGTLPDYGQYLGFLGSLTFGKVGAITYDFSRWSAGLAVGVAYAASAAALVLVTRRRRDLVERERPTLAVLCGLTAYGIMLFSYFVDRSANHILPYISLPALLAGALWLTLLLRNAPAAARGVRLGALGFALALATLLTAVAWSSIGDRYSRSALGHIAGGGPSLSDALHNLAHRAPLDPRAPAGEALLARYMPGRERVLTLVVPDLETEILMRSGRISRLPLSYPTEDSFASGQYLPKLRRAVAGLKPGELLLTQTLGLKDFATLKAQPTRDPLREPVGLNLAPLQEWVMKEISRRFDLRVISRGDAGFIIAALQRRR